MAAPKKLADIDWGHNTLWPKTKALIARMDPDIFPTLAYLLSAMEEDVQDARLKLHTAPPVLTTLWETQKLLPKVDTCAPEHFLGEKE